MHESRFRLLRLYYTNRIFMGVCCVSTEVLYLCLFMARDDELSAVRGLLPDSSGVIETFSHVQAFDEFLVQTVGIGSLHVCDAVCRLGHSWVFVEANGEYRAVTLGRRGHVQPRTGVCVEKGKKVIKRDRERERL